MELTNSMLAYSLTWLLLVVYSFTRLDLNLTLYRFIPSFFQQLGFYQRPLATFIYLILALSLTIIYLKPKGSVLKGRTLLVWAVLLAITGVFAYPMFSYDLFNYLFNAKMVLIFKANPHIQTAIEFPDAMLRFMHNIHTPAPYAYGWTAISLIPGLAWFLDKFTLSFWAMKTFIALFWFGQLLILKNLVLKNFPKEPYRWWLFALSPLVLIETLINGHNDVVMMLPALVSLYFLQKSTKIIDKNFLHSLFFLTISASVKYATLILLPFYFLKRKVDLPTLFSWVLLAIMFTRPDQLHSWYLIWAFSFAVLSKSRLTLSIMTALTIGAVLRYAPYIYFGTWDSSVYLQRNLIWLGSLILAPFIYKKITMK